MDEESGDESAVEMLGECPICLDEITSRHRTVCCTSGCGGVLHQVCRARWQKEVVQQGRNACPVW